MKIWNINFSSSAEKSFSKLDKPTQKKISNYLLNKIAPSENPKLFGKPLVGKLKGLWRYRVENYRILCRIENDVFEILVIDIGHRSDIYN